MIPSTHAELLKSKSMAIIGSVGKRGEPHTSPVWFGWDGERIKFSCTKDRQKTANISRDGRVSVLILDINDPYKYLEIRGTAAIIDDPDKSFINEMAFKYRNSAFPDRPSEERVVISITPERVIAYPKA